MTSPQTKLDLSNIQTYNRNANWTSEKKEAISRAMAEYPNIPQIAIEVAYDFSLKFDGNEDMDKYLKGEFLSKADRRRLHKKMNPTNYKIERNDYKADTVLNTVSVKHTEEVVDSEQKATLPILESTRSWYSLF